MHAFAVTKYAHPSEISLTSDFPEPEAGPIDVIVDVYSAGLNYFDVRSTNKLSNFGILNDLPPYPHV